MSDSKKHKVVSAYDELVKTLEKVSGVKFDKESLKDFDIKKDRAREAKLAAAQIKQELQINRKKAIGELYKKGVVNQNIVFESLNKDEFNKDAIEGAQIFCYTAQATDKNEVPLLFIQGAEGTGKTSLCHAIANYWLNFNSSSVLICTFEQIRKTRLFYNSDDRIDRDDRDERWEMFCNRNLLILDGLLQNREGLQLFDQRVLSDLLRTRFQRGLPMVITTPVTFNNLHACVGDFCYESIREYTVLAKSLYGGSRRNPLVVNGVEIR